MNPTRPPGTRGVSCAAIIPTFFALLVTIPAMVPDAGLFGIGLGIFTPVFVLLSYWLTWAIPAYLWVGLCGMSPTLCAQCGSHTPW